MNTIEAIQYEPKRNNRFLVKFPEQFDVELCSILKINKPKFTDGQWENIRVDFVDLIGPSTSQSLFKIVNFLKTNDSDDKKLFDVKIQSLDPTEEIIEEWVVYVEKVLTINFGELDYGSDEIQKPFLILKPLNCILNY